LLAALSRHAESSAGLSAHTFPAVALTRDARPFAVSERTLAWLPAELAQRISRPLAADRTSLTPARRFEKIYRDHYDAIWRYVQFKGVGLDVEEIVADVFTTAWRKLKDIPEEKAGAWLYAVTRNKIGDAMRDKARRIPMTLTRDEVHDVQVVDDPANAVLEQLTFEGVLNALDNDLDREILYLIVHDDLSPTDVAQILGLKRTAVSMRIRRLNDKLAAFRPASVSPPHEPSDDE
jgi:RNA polymerase sigma-70 factor (ECF subfamily)